jgi:hypothetical protein
MNHPTNEEWMSYVYRETTGVEHARLAEHLQNCPQCQTGITEWQALQKNLDDWQIPAHGAAGRKSKQLHSSGAWLKWAAALALFAGIGFGVGRVSMLASINPEKLRAAIEPEIRQQLRQEFAQTLRQELDKTASATLTASREQARGLLDEYDDARAVDDQAISAALDQLQSQQTADYVSLKKQLDTVAVLTDAGLRQTQDQVVRLAAYTEPKGTLNSPKR